MINIIIRDSILSDGSVAWNVHLGDNVLYATSEADAADFVRQLTPLIARYTVEEYSVESYSSISPF